MDPFCPLWLDPFKFHISTPRDDDDDENYVRKGQEQCRKVGDASRGWLAPQLIIISRDNVGHHHDEDEEDNDDEDKVDDDSEDFIITNFINFINVTTQSLCLPQDLRPHSSL